MNTTMARISRLRRDIEDIPASDPITRATNGCHRCGGMLVDEHCMDIGEEGSGHRFWGMRCLQCGDVIDETILRNRYALAQTVSKLRSRTRLRVTALALAGSVQKRSEICPIL